MEDELEKLINSEFTVNEILEAAKKLRKNKIIRCSRCNHRLGDIEDGMIIIKCKCGEYGKYII
ncbi:hypothetical protein [Helicovermis profundi]|uniref:Uncharacterized protein n=1 Tax=Helicovermis profundi TaxID=3065157 RepID=A0AAU9E606_9FIRM|nr:hypothetical protein HLPR_11290 [Clostridia bacterium S502]